MKLYLLQALDEEGKVIRQRGFRDREERDQTLLYAYKLFHRSRTPDMHAVRLRDPDGYEAISEPL